MFRKQNIQSFLYNVIKDEDVTIIPIIKYTKLEECVPCEIRISSILDDSDMLICFILLNRIHFCYEKNSNLLKAYLLHEIGHCFHQTDGKSHNELVAHLWAFKKAEEMKLPKVIDMLEKTIENWGTISWKDYAFRRYIMAYRQWKILIENI